MKTTRRTLLSTAAGLPYLASHALLRAQNPEVTRVKIDAEQVTARVNPMIFGNFIEHLGRCIYGGIYDEGSPLADAQGFRKDVLSAVERLRLPVLRWPGGNFVSSYHWEDGVGSKEKRPRRFDTAWYAEESNRFGTNEFIQYCHRIHAEPYICVNLGTGSIQEAANWVEYCNGTGDTEYANLRRKHGYPEPHNVKYWGLGNEIYGIWQAGHKNAEDYAKIAMEAGKLMKWTDPSIRLIACGATPEWNATVLDVVGPIADYLSVHLYVGGDDYYELLATIRRAEHLLRVTDSVIEVAEARRLASPRTGSIGFPVREKRIEIAFDEWNVWYRRRDGRERAVKNKLEEPYNLRDALWTASMIHLFQRWGDKVTMANLAQLVNVIAPIITSPTGMYLQPTFFPLELYRRESGDRVLHTWTQGPTFSSKSFGAIEYLDVCATRDEQGALSIGVVNRHKERPLRAEFQVEGMTPKRAGKVYMLNGPTPDSRNSFEAPQTVGVSSREHAEFGPRFSLEFPAHSVSLIKI
ncbi:MAG TPA: alpha-L-arabinofuranosidase C-terminal domain-containing protein [Bryobacteraceae bacterium]|nr:alpha-L-arabinofuranosidase C-terminal domain-containing protein [Bryobacteraceae bacterium]